MGCSSRALSQRATQQGRVCHLMLVSKKRRQSLHASRGEVKNPQSNPKRALTSHPPAAERTEPAPRHHATRCWGRIPNAACCPALACSAVPAGGRSWRADGSHAEHRAPLPAPELGSPTPQHHPEQQHKVAPCRGRVFRARPRNKKVVLHSLLQPGASRAAPGWPPSQLRRGRPAPAPPEGPRAGAAPS